MRKLLCVIIALSLAFPSMAKSRNVTVVISLDGCRWDYPLWYDTPFLDYMSAQGVEAGLIPSFPSKTFPNHYTIATGLYPDHHGIIANTFLDTETGEVFSLSAAEQKHNPKFYGGEPIWNTAQRQGLTTSVFYWPGSDVKVGGSYPDHYYDYDAKPRLTLAERLDGVVEELSKEDGRPDLIMAYLDQPDGNGHNYGPQSRETRMAVKEVDSLLMNMYLRILALPIGRQVNLIVLSDHGMTWVEPSRRIDLTHRLNPAWVVDSQGNIPEGIYAAPGCVDSIYNALKDLPHAQVWRKNEVPAYLHYGTNPRIGDVVVLPDLGYIVYNKPIEAGGGMHGYDNTLSDMHALFRAIGPDFRHVALPHFANVNVYSLLCQLLDITPAPNDGTLDAVRPMLRGE